MKINWLWDMQVRESHVRNILNNKNHPEFNIFAEKLFARVKDPHLVFGYVDKNTFVEKWPTIKKIILKDAWAKPSVQYWQKIYSGILNDYKIKANRIRKFDQMVPHSRRELAQEIKDTRISHGLTQKQIALKLGVIQPHISRIESGRENVTFDTLSKIAKALNKHLVIRFA